jgi:hypothetical protein
MWALMLLASLATAGELYVNGVKATGLRSQDFEGCDVRIDERGDIWVTAPRYVVRSAEEPQAPAPRAGAQGTVSAGRWWLVTEDHSSSGHSVEVFVNGTLVRRVGSGEPQVILDLAPWLVPGNNNVTFSALPGPVPGGGALHIYLGAGYNDAGVVRISDPQIDFLRRSSDPPSGGMEDFVLTVSDPRESP